MSKTILLADDSLTIQKVVELTFMEGDLEVTSVSNGDDALGHLEESPADLVIADIHMPGASGYEICRQAITSRTVRPCLSASRPTPETCPPTFESLEVGSRHSSGGESPSR